jgi:transaldolase / glucose-6-phosphate isomerase
MANAENPLKQLERFGQAVWLDYIRRHLLTSAEFRRILDNDGLKGMTSNPTIFEKAIAGSTDYDDQLKELAPSKKNIDEIYEALSMQDIRMAADAFRPLYDKSGGIHGYISYEVSPTLANNTDGTIAAARRYWDALARPNVMIKVPSTPAGLPAIEQLISEGLNVNVTLMFSMKHYDDVAEAFVRGLERRLKAGKSIDKVWSVASVFVSRVETLVDRKLEGKLKASPNEAVAALMGKSAVANSRLIYQRYKEIFAGTRFKDVLAKGGRPQWPLWASTGTKNHAYSDVKYVEELVGPDTVNTMPPATMDAFRDHGKPRASLEERVSEARDIVKRLAAVGIDLIEVGEELQKEGVESFAQSFEDLSAVIKGRRAAIVDGAHDKQLIAASGYESQVSAAYKDLDKNEFPARLLKKDATLWSKEPKEQEAIKNGLGFLTVPETMYQRVKELVSFADEVRNAGFRDVVLLGMGGSSQSAELFAATFPAKSGYPKLHVLDSTVPETIRALDRNIDITKTLFVVASKTGQTIETLSQCNAFFERVKAKSSNPAGSHFVAITDPGTKLAALAKEYKFRRVFLNPASIVGCYSVLSYFGLVPAALIGMDVATLVDRAIRMTHSSAGCVRVEENLGVSLGAALGALKKAGRDKLTFIISPPINAFGLWVEQLISESTSKNGIGIVPVCDEPLVDAKSYGKDRAFVYLRLSSGADAAQDAAFEAIKKANIPTVQITLPDKIDLGEEFMRWEIASVTAAAVIGVDPFAQPGVQESKDNTSRILAEFARSKTFPPQSPIAEKGKLALFSGGTAAEALKGKRDFREIIGAFVNLAKVGDYFAAMAYVSPNPTVDKEIATIRKAIVDRYGIATTFGYGPRCLHSTGQLHKGGPNTGLFLQITQYHRDAIVIPGASYDFAQLNQAQYLGDFQSLEAHGRRVLRVHLAGQDPIGAIEALRNEVVAAIAR